MKLSEIANQAIALARKIHDYYAAELPKRHRNYPVVGVGEETAPAPPEEGNCGVFLID